MSTSLLLISSLENIVAPKNLWQLLYTGIAVCSWKSKHQSITCAREPPRPDTFEELRLDDKPEDAPRVHLGSRVQDLGSRVQGLEGQPRR
jgi:hypothetical protein